MSVHFDPKLDNFTKVFSSRTVHFEHDPKRKLYTIYDLLNIPAKNAIKIKIFISTKLLINRTLFCYRGFKYANSSIYPPVIPGLSFLFDVV